MMMETPKFPRKLEFLFRPARYKVAYGGRGGAKSWGFARALLLLGIHKKLRILCTREVQKSIRDSVHKLLDDQIQMLGLGHKYQVLDQEIRGTNGTEIIFAGLSALTVESIKSYEGCDIVWVEEGQTISNRSWKILIPTIRKDDRDKYTPVLEASEIWISFNPELETDPTFERFVLNPPPGAIVVKMNWRDNPWFNEVLEAERLHCKATEPKDYPNIWEGECKPAVEGAIYYDEMTAMRLTGRIRNVPYDSMLKAHVVVDLGFNDQVSVSIVQKQASEIRIINYIEENHRALDGISADLKELKYNWGKVWLPYADGFSLGSSGQKSADMIMKAQSWDVAEKVDVANVGVEAGIREVRLAFPRIYIDQTNCDRLLECLRRYRRNINARTLEAGAPCHDEFCHGADNVRYIVTNIDQMTNETDAKPMPIVPSYGVLDEAVGY